VKYHFSVLWKEESSLNEYSDTRSGHLLPIYVQQSGDDGRMMHVIREIFDQRVELMAHGSQTQLFKGMRDIDDLAEVPIMC
jgi:hypothetical protein